MRQTTPHPDPEHPEMIPVYDDDGERRGEMSIVSRFADGAVYVNGRWVSGPAPPGAGPAGSVRSPAPAATFGPGRTSPCPGSGSAVSLTAMAYLPRSVFTRAALKRERSPSPAIDPQNRNTAAAQMASPA